MADDRDVADRIRQREESAGDRFTVKRYLSTDKHGFTRHAYNAKINIYREHAEPIFLGVQDKDLHQLGTAEEVVPTTG